jgi:hypothetical protein
VAKEDSDTSGRMFASTSPHGRALLAVKIRKSSAMATPTGRRLRDKRRASTLFRSVHDVVMDSGHVHRLLLTAWHTRHNNCCCYFLQQQHAGCNTRL